MMQLLHLMTFLVRQRLIEVDVLLLLNFHEHLINGIFDHNLGEGRRMK